MAADMLLLVMHPPETLIPPILTTHACSNIVCVRGIGAANLESLDAMRGSIYMVMEAMEGDDLKMMVLRQMTSRWGRMGGAHSWGQACRQ